MLDIKFIRQNPDIVKEGCNKKGVKVDIDKLLEVDQKRREALQEVEKSQSEENRISYLVSRETDPAKKDELIRKGQRVKGRIKEQGDHLKKLTEEFEKLMCSLPNLPQDDVPVGKSEKDNVVLREWGKKPNFRFKPKDYLEIAENLDIIDVKRAAKVAGTRFGYIKGEAALLEFALVNLAFDILVKEGFVPVVPPVMLKSEMARGMGYLEQGDKEEAYYLPQDDLYLVGTSEQSIGAMHAGEVFQKNELPRRYAGFSTCFRRESGSYGKDTKGILRVHQFDKVEMFSFSHPDESQKEHKFLLSMEEKLMKALKIPYRVLQMCTVDIAHPQAAKYDIEAWLPAAGEYRETHSTSTCTDFQARRLNIRYRDGENKKPEFVHTLNGTALAIGRMLIAIIENYQQKDGSVLVPKVLQKYTKFTKIPRKK